MPEPDAGMAERKCGSEVCQKVRCVEPDNCHGHNRSGIRNVGQTGVGSFEVGDRTEEVVQEVVDGHEHPDPTE